VTAPLPEAAQRALEEATVCHVAAATDAGPHLTPVVFVLHGGALWMTTSRASVKARAWRRDPRVAGMARAGGVAVTFRGRVRTYDALDPLTWPAAAVGGPGLARAAARFALRNARFFAGYAVDAPRVPVAWGPVGRVFLRLSLDQGVVVDPETGERLAGWGKWPPPGDAAFRPSYTQLPRSRALDLRAPPEVRRAVGNAGDGALVLDGGDGRVVLPVRWRRRAAEGAFEACLPVALCRLARVPARAVAGLVLDRPDEWRAGQMAGMLLRGDAELFAPGTTRRGVTALRGRVPDGWALVRLQPSRLVWWRGWTSGTVAA